jgi:hypothetical protein
MFAMICVHAVANHDHFWAGRKATTSCGWWREVNSPIAENNPPRLHNRNEGMSG